MRWHKRDRIMAVVACVVLYSSAAILVLVGARVFPFNNLSARTLPSWLSTVATVTTWGGSGAFLVLTLISINTRKRRVAEWLYTGAEVAGIIMWFGWLITTGMVVVPGAKVNSEQIWLPLTLPALAAFAIFASKFALSAVLVPIIKGIPALIFGIFARNWWDKHKPKKPDPQT